MTTATATPSCKVTRSSRDTPPAAECGGAGGGGGGRRVGGGGGGSGTASGCGLPVLTGRMQWLDRGEVVDLHGRVRHRRIHGHGQGDQTAATEPGPQPDPHWRQMPKIGRA